MDLSTNFFYEHRFAVLIITCTMNFPQKSVFGGGGGCIESGILIVNCSLALTCTGLKVKRQRKSSLQPSVVLQRKANPQLGTNVHSEDFGCFGCAGSQ